MKLIKAVTNIFNLIGIVIRRLWHNLGISISALIGIIAVLTIIVCVQMFSYSISSEVLHNQLLEQANNTNRRLFSFHSYYVSSGTGAGFGFEDAEGIRSYIYTRTQELLGVPVERVVMEIHSDNYNVYPISVRGRTDDREILGTLRLITLDMLPEYTDIVEGQFPADQISPSQPVQAAISETMADLMFLNVGDRLRVDNLEVEITGIWKERNQTDPVWFRDPQVSYNDKIWIPEAVYRSRVVDALPNAMFSVSWYTIINEANLNFQDSTAYERGLVRLNSELTRSLPDFKTDYSPLEALAAYKQRSEALITLFYTVGSPMIVLALLFIGLTSRIAVQQYENEVATMRGRGTSWRQVVLMNLAESGMLLLVAVPASLLCGWLAARLMSQTVSFLRFTPRSGFQLSLEGINFLWLGLAAVLIVAARLLPLLGGMRRTIVKMKQEQSRQQKKPFWERFYLDFLLLIPAIYAYTVMKGWAKPAGALAQMQIASEQYRDPLLFIAPAVLTIALCMIALRIVPLIVHLLAALFERLPGVWAYLSLQQIYRRTQDYTSPLLLIMISLSLAIFSASTAKTLDKWLNDSVYYQSGADLALQEYVMEQTSASANCSAGDPACGGEIQLSSLDVYSMGFTAVEQHLGLPGVSGATRVGIYKGSYSYGVGEQACTVMGIDRLEFPQVAFYRDDFSAASLGALMNSLAIEPMGVLIPQQMADELGLGVGDHLSVSANILDINYAHDHVITGIYNYFPTVYPSETPTVIANLDAIFDNPDAVMGYQVWLDLQEGTDVDELIGNIRKMIGEDTAVVSVVADALASIKAGQDQPERVGLFGILNVGFIITGLMPGIGFLLYSYASLRRRFIQLGILQAIGLSVKQLVAHLVLEQVLLMGIAIACGAGVGLATSYLFVPFLQTGAVPGAPIPPFEVKIGWVEAGWLSLGFAFVLIATMIATIVYLARLKVFQAVKLGETL